MDAEMDTVQFAAERNERLVDFDREMRLLVIQALQLYVDGDPNWIEPIVTGSAVLWLEIFAREAPDAYPDSVLRDFQALATRSLKKTVTPEDPPAQAQIDRVTNWIGTLTVNDATFHANRAVRGKTMTWITMRDEAVRPVHVATDGQNVSVNGTFDVGGYGLRYPGEPVGPPNIWMNCRCLIAPGKVKKAMTASLAVTEEVPPATPPVEPEAEAPEEEDDDLIDSPAETPWHAVLAPMGVKSGDDRMFALNALTWRNLPLPLTYQHQSTEGHGGSFVVGRIDEIWIENDMALARGVFQQTEEADKVIEGIAGGFIRGVSVDVDEVALQEEDMSMTVFTAARIAGATLVSIPAFQEAFVALGADFEAAADPALAASAGCNCQSDEFGDEQYEQFAPGTRDGPGWITNPVDTQRLRRYWTKGEGAAKIKWGVPGDFNRCRIQLGKYVNPLFLAGTCANLHKEALGVWPGMESGGRGRLGAEVLTASALHLVAAGTAPVDGEWFQNPQLLAPTPLTVTDDGRIFGHVAAWGSCHIGLPGACTTPPKSYSKYAYYRTGVVSTTTGDIAVGQITMSTGHASIKANARAAAAHYDNTGSAVADVAAGEDSYGIWIAGAMRASATPEQRDQLRAGSLSGDWRTIGGSLEMVAALAVNVPGFPIPRTSLAASGDQQESLVASGVVEHAIVAGGGLSAEDVAAIVRTTIDEVAFRAERAGRLVKGLEAKASIRAKRIGFARARLTKGE